MVPVRPSATLPAWKTLATHYPTMHHLHQWPLFAEGPPRGERLADVAAGLYCAYLKSRIADETLPLPLQLAADCDLCAPAGEPSFKQVSATNAPIRRYRGLRAARL